MYLDEFIDFATFTGEDFRAEWCSYDLTEVTAWMPKPVPYRVGEWVLMSDADGYFCACASCGEWSPTRKQLIFCPNCGEPKKITEKWLKLDYGKNAVNPYP